MRLKIKIVSLNTLLTFSACSTQKRAMTAKKIFSGKWVLVQDSLSSLIVKGNRIIVYYNNVSIDTISYTIASESCDPAYTPYKMKNNLFLSWEDGICSEIEYLTKENLMLLNTANGELSTYRTQK